MSAHRVCQLALAGLALAVPLACQVDDFDRAEPAPEQDPSGAPPVSADPDQALPPCNVFAEILDGTYVDRFGLFTECAPVYAVGLVSGDEAEEMGLTKERVWTMVESRLRAARLYDSGGGQMLELNIRTFSPAFDISLELFKSVQDPRSGESGVATTWERDTIGTHGGSASFIMQTVSEYLDGFILDYLRVNEEACG